MPINPPIEPSDPPPVYCTECGCEVDPAAWLCATCGKKLHEPDAMTSTPLITPVTSKKSKPDIIRGAQIFVILLIVVFFILDIGFRIHLIPAWIPGHPFGSPAAIYLVLLGIILWAVLTYRE
jgi:hypothetical protein